MSVPCPSSVSGFPSGSVPMRRHVPEGTVGVGGKRSDSTFPFSSTIPIGNGLATSHAVGKTCRNVSYVAAHPKPPTYSPGLNPLAFITPCHSSPSTIPGLIVTSIPGSE